MTEKSSKSQQTAKSPYEMYTENQIKTAFEVFDEDRNGRAKLKHLGTILTALGRVISTEELKEIKETVEDKDCPKYMRLHDLLPVAMKLLLQDSYKSSSKTSIQRSFSILDREGRGSVDADYLLRVFKDSCEIYEDDVMEKFINESVAPGTRRINYKDLSEKLISPSYFDIEDNRRKIRLELNRENVRT